jgi:hypothetical protein
LADINEVIVMSSDQPDDGWQWGVKFWHQLNQLKQKVMATMYSWDRDLELWVENNLYQYFFGGLLPRNLAQGTIMVQSMLLSWKTGTSTATCRPIVPS